MKYKFLYDNLKAGDLVKMRDDTECIFSFVSRVHCNCNPEYWSEHFHLSSYICQYDNDSKCCDHTSRVIEIWKFTDDNTIKRVAVKKPIAKQWLSAEEIEPVDTAKERLINQLEDFLNDLKLSNKR